MNLVFKIMSPSSSFFGVDYNERKEEQGVASMIYFENFGYLQERSQISKKDFKDFLKQHSARNERVKKPQFHAILSCKGQSYTHKELKEKAIKIMNKLGYEGQPILIYQHSDTDNNHVHIITSRVGRNGKKINDKYEGVRARKIVNEMLAIDVKNECSQALKDALQYHITTQSQFSLLLEKKGYRVKAEGEEMVLFKHGQRQGSIATSEITKTIERSKHIPLDKERIQKLILEYKKQYSSHLINNSSANKPSVERTYSSALTHSLFKNEGLEFHFFASKGHDLPYGYLIIDHNNKYVLKGSEVMKLGQLIGSSQEENGKEARNRDAALPVYTVNKLKKNENEERSVEVPFIPEGSFSEAIDAIIDDAMQENETSGRIKRRKKKRKNSY
jgi:hypothetical protein